MRKSYGYNRGSAYSSYERRTEKSPRKAVQMGLTGSALSMLSTPLSQLAAAGLQNKKAMQEMVQESVFLTIESAVGAQRSWEQMRDTNGNE